MIEAQETIYNRMKADSELLKLLGLDDSAVEADISKRLVPTPPNRMNEPALIHFRFPQTVKSFQSSLWEHRSVQFRIWVKDNSLRTQQKISERLQEIFVNQEIEIPRIGHYSKFFYVGEGEIGAPVEELYGWFLELQFGNEVRYFSEGG